MKITTEQLLADVATLGYSIDSSAGYEVMAQACWENSELLTRLKDAVPDTTWQEVARRVANRKASITQRIRADARKILGSMSLQEIARVLAVTDPEQAMLRRAIWQEIEDDELYQYHSGNWFNLLYNELLHLDDMAATGAAMG